MIATSLLPISGTTLAYGSDDGGQTVHKDNKTLNKVMKAAGLHMMMKPHMVGFNDPKKIYGPCDIEGHIGKDARFYVCDTARCFAPEVPSIMFVGLLLEHDGLLSDRSSINLANLPPIKELELSVSGWKAEAQTLLGGPYETALFVGGTILYSPSNCINSRASALLGMFSLKKKNILLFLLPLFLMTNSFISISIFCRTKSLWACFGVTFWISREKAVQSVPARVCAEIP
ncbi:MAG: hypothetical protein Q8P67_24755 [archaeon]|nr:hypothetical protein [archaeon]